MKFKVKQGMYLKLKKDSIKKHWELSHMEERYTTFWKVNINHNNCVHLTSLELPAKRWYMGGDVFLQKHFKPATIKETEIFEQKLVENEI